MTRPAMLPPSEWPIGTALVLTEKRALPIMPPDACAPDFDTSRAAVSGPVLTLFPPERLRLQRLLNHARHAVCLHGSQQLLLVATKHLRPLEPLEPLSRRLIENDA